ncbi:MAG: sulfotransferase [Hyphomonadaceae bacterium]
MTGDAATSLIAEAYRLLQIDPVRAETLLHMALKQTNDPGASLMLAGALRLQGKSKDALARSEALAKAHPNWPGAQFEHALALAAVGRDAEALPLLQNLQRMNAGVPGVWREIGDRYWALGDQANAERAYINHVDDPALEPAVHAALTAQQRGDRAAAEAAFQLQLSHYPSDILAMRHLAEHYSAEGKYEDAEILLHRVIERAPGFALARYGLAMVLIQLHRPAEALVHSNALLTFEPTRYEFLNLKAETLSRLGDFDGSARALEGILQQRPNDAAAWSTYGDLLRALGRRAECETAYKRAIALNPGAGIAYWGLANLKTYRFSANDVAAMRAQAPKIPDGDDKSSMLFALGKALEDHQDFAEAFQAYSAANAMRRASLPHDAGEAAEKTRRVKTVFTPSFFAERKGYGAAQNDPIFIVGMPRSGSTLVEQILASHSAVEGTMELVDLLAITKRLGAQAAYPELLRDLTAQQVRAIGDEYLSRTRVFRQTDAPRFIDKMPNNFLETGFIQLALPNATIIDVRRNPLACCVSNFKQHWATGQSFAYDLTDIGAFYRNYVELMAHFDAVSPGRVHRVIYENLIADPEAETRRLLDACGLPFEDACLRFYENQRAVRTPSSEQVRKPIFKGGVDNWRPFEPWLAPLKDALGPVLDYYPDAPPSA